MTNEDNVIEGEIVENLPAVIEQEPTHSPDAPIQGRDWSTYSRPERRCTAHSSRTGEQCKNVAIKGHNVCRYHGGAAKQIKQAARNRLDNAADRMARELLGIALAGESDSVRLVAIRDALDRSGITKPQEVVLGLADTKPYQEVFDEIAGVSRAESRRARGLLEPDAEDGSNSSGYAAGYVGDPGTHHFPAGADSTPASAALADYESHDSGPPSATPAAEAGARDAQQRGKASRRPVHLTGDAALAVAAELAREQLALESGGHKRYRQHRQ